MALLFYHITYSSVCIILDTHCLQHLYIRISYLLKMTCACTQTQDIFNKLTIHIYYIISQCVGGYLVIPQRAGWITSYPPVVIGYIMQT